jgi:hypothetical protein
MLLAIPSTNGKYWVNSRLWIYIKNFTKILTKFKLSAVVSEHTNAAKLLVRTKQEIICYKYQTLYMGLKLIP